MIIDSPPSGGELLITREFNKMVDEIVKIREADHDLPAKSTEKDLIAISRR